MSKKILVLSTSPRKGGNSDLLADAFARGAREAGNTVEKISLSGLRVDFCRGCLSCLNTKRCVIQDDAAAIVQKMKDADVLVFATPVYYFNMCGQMKTLLDRANPLYTADYRFRDVYLLAAAAETGAHTVDGTVTGLQGWIDCFAQARLAGTVFAGGVTAAGQVQGHPVLEKAYAMGKNVSGGDCHERKI